MPSRLYVGNLSYSTTEDALREFFATAGEVKTAEVVMDRQTGRSKGFAFVEMVNDEGAQKAIQMLNGKTLDSRQLRIDIAKPKEQRPRMGGAASSFGSADRSRRSRRDDDVD